jgi:lysophospholipase L1-like esterase
LQTAGINAFFVGSGNDLADADVRQKWHDGVDGTRVNSAQAGLITSTVTHCPEVICYCLGTNDCNADNTAAATTAAAIQTNVKAIWDAGQRPGINRVKLIEVCSPPATPANNDKTAALALLLPGVITNLRALGVNALFVDLFTGLGTNNVGNGGAMFNPASSPHPNDAGYVKIAQMLFGTPGSGLLCDWGR